MLSSVLFCQQLSGVVWHGWNSSSQHGSGPVAGILECMVTPSSLGSHIKPWLYVKYIHERNFYNHIYRGISMQKKIDCFTV